MAEQKEMSGTFPGGAEWTFHFSDEVPELGTQEWYSAVGCVIMQAPGVVVLTCDMTRTDERRGMWELPSGHAEAGETVEEVIRRELDEECGAGVGRLYPFGYRRVHNPVGDERHRAGTSLMPYFAAVVEGELRLPSDQGKPVAAGFIPGMLTRMEEFGMIDPIEVKIVRAGIETLDRRVEGHR